MKITRRDGFYEATGNGRYFQIARLGKRWELKECFGSVAGWGEPDFFGTFREAKEEASARIEMSEGS